MTSDKKNAVLSELIAQIKAAQAAILQANQEDVAAYTGNDNSMLDRLMVNEKKVKSILNSIEEAMDLSDPEGLLLYSFRHENGMRIENRSVPFGKILIIYESRPDVTIEAAVAAFKAGNKILLKGGKEARRTNLVLTACWHRALASVGFSEDWVSYLNLDRTETQKLIKENTEQVDLIIPRGGEGLINFVKQNTNIPVIVSGRGNNFLYLDAEADFSKAVKIILNGKSRISVCNALDKVLIDTQLPDFNSKVSILVSTLKEANIEVFGTSELVEKFPEIKLSEDSEVWEEEFLAAKILLGRSESMQSAIYKINTCSGGHSAAIITENENTAREFMQKTDCAAVYHNASTRFTDGGQFGFGGEMAISTQKVHFRGPIGIGQLVTNKWFCYGEGQIR